SLLSSLLTRPPPRPTLFPYTTLFRSPTSVPARIAAQGGYPYVSRDVFLDNERDVRAIERELLHAVYRAERKGYAVAIGHPYAERSEEHTSELQSLTNLVCRLLLEKKK